MCAAAEHTNRSRDSYCYRGDGTDGIHLLGPLAKKVVRIAPPLTITEDQAEAAMTLMAGLLAPLAANAGVRK